MKTTYYCPRGCNVFETEIEDPTAPLAARSCSPTRNRSMRRMRKGS